MKHEVIKYADSIIYQLKQIHRKVDSDAVTDPAILAETLAVLKKADDQIDDILTSINFPADFQTLMQGSAKEQARENVMARGRDAHQEITNLNRKNA